MYKPPKYYIILKFPNASFIAGNGYEVQTKSFAVINEIPEIIKVVNED